MYVTYLWRHISQGDIQGGRRRSWLRHHWEHPRRVGVGAGTVPLEQCVLCVIFLAIFNWFIGEGWREETGNNEARSTGSTAFYNCTLYTLYYSIALSLHRSAHTTDTHVSVLPCVINLLHNIYDSYGMTLVYANSNLTINFYNRMIGPIQVRYSVYTIVYIP